MNKLIQILTINNRPADEKQINRDLQNLNHNITVREKNLNHFFQNEGRFLGTQNLIILPKPEMPNFLRTNNILSTNNFF